MCPNISKKRYHCKEDGCHLIFDRPSKLLRHELLHYGVKKYPCPADDCGKSYSTPSHLNRHMKSHRPDTKKSPAYRCSYPYCQYLFKTKWGLRRHEKKHLNTNYCEACNMHFDCSLLYTKHINQHANRCLQKCRECGKSFIDTTRQKYVRHERRCSSRPHYFADPSNNSPESEGYSGDVFICDHCGSHFDRKIKIMRHVIDCYSLHRSIFICGYPLCARVFFYKRNLRQHIRCNHTSPKYSCLVNR